MARTTPSEDFDRAAENFWVAKGDKIGTEDDYHAQFSEWLDDFGGGTNKQKTTLRQEVRNRVLRNIPEYRKQLEKEGLGIPPTPHGSRRPRAGFVKGKLVPVRIYRVKLSHPIGRRKYRIVYRDHKGRFASFEG